MNRPKTTLFLVQSLDGKITTGISDKRDFDTDLVADELLKDGMADYYNIEKTTDYWSCISGRIAAKLGANDGLFFKEHKHVCFVIITNHLEESGILHIARNCDKCVIVTTGDKYDEVFLPSTAKLWKYQELNMKILLYDLYRKMNVDSLTIQTGGSLNAEWFAADCVDCIKLVLAPVIIGGFQTSTLVDGVPLMENIATRGKYTNLELINVRRLHQGFLCLDYNVNRSKSIVDDNNNIIQGLINCASLS